MVSGVEWCKTFHLSIHLRTFDWIYFTAYVFCPSIMVLRLQWHIFFKETCRNIILARCSKVYNERYLWFQTSFKSFPSEQNTLHISRWIPLAVWWSLTPFSGRRLSLKPSGGTQWVLGAFSAPGINLWKCQSFVGPVGCFKEIAEIIHVFMFSSETLKTRKLRFLVFFFFCGPRGLKFCQQSLEISVPGVGWIWIWSIILSSDSCA